MTRKATSEDYRTLHLSEDATIDDLRRAYHRMKALYAENSLATYSLMEEEQRLEILHRIERAYMLISQDLRLATESASPQLPFLDPGQRVAPGPDERIGPFLRQRREMLGYTLKEVAQRTRIRSLYIEQIENEHFRDLPAKVYLRGFVLEYARLLGLTEPEKVSHRFLEQASSRGEP